MTRPEHPRAARTAVLVYLAMVATVLVTILTSATLHGAAALPHLGPPWAGAAPIVVALGVGLGVMALRDRLPARASGESADAWWERNLPRAVAIWTLAEGLALLGGVFYLLTGRAVALSAAALGLALLAFCSPGTLVDR
jgi:hypothetical protein